MATSGTVDTNVFSFSGATAKFSVRFSLKSQNQVSNTSVCTVSVYWVGTGGPIFYTNAITVNSSTIGGGVWSNQSGNGDHLLLSQDVTIQHDSNGNANITLSVNGAFYGSGTLSGSGTFSLTQILRASSITSVTSSAGADDSVVLNGTETVTVAINRLNSSFTHTVTWLAPDGTVMATQTAQATSATLTPAAAAWLAKVPNAMSATATVRVQTMSGSTAIGNPSSMNFTVNVPTTTLPTVGNPAATRTGQTAVAAYVQGKSGVTVAFASGVAGSGASIAGWTISGPDGSNSGSGATGNLVVPTVATTGTQTYTLTLTDTRGQSVTKTVNITVYAYSPPTLTNFSVYRSTSNGTSSPGAGTYLRTLATAGYSTVNSLNTVTLGVAWKLSTAASYPANTAFVSGTALVVGGGNVTIGGSWNVRWQVTDKFTTTETVITVPSAAALIDLYDPGDAGTLWVGIGKRAEGPGLDIGLNTRIRGELAIDGGIPAKLIPANDDLNGYITPGSFVQNVNANATTALHYPVASAAGLLVVDRLVDSTGVWTFQRFTRYSNGLSYYRAQYPAGTWIGWAAPGVNASLLSSGTLPIARIAAASITPDKLADTATLVFPISSSILYQTLTTAWATLSPSWSANVALTAGRRYRVIIRCKTYGDSANAIGGVQCNAGSYPTIVDASFRADSGASSSGQDNTFLGYFTANATETVTFTVMAKSFVGTVRFYTAGPVGFLGFSVEPM